MKMSHNHIFITILPTAHVGKVTTIANEQAMHQRQGAWIRAVYRVGFPPAMLGGHKKHKVVF